MKRRMEAHTLTGRVNAITESRIFQVSIACKRLTGFTETCNIVRQKEAVAQFCTAVPMNTGSRSWRTIPQLSATKSELSDANGGYKRENQLTEQGNDDYRGSNTHPIIPIVDMVHSMNLLVCIVSVRKWRGGVQVREVPLSRPSPWPGFVISLTTRSRRRGMADRRVGGPSLPEGSAKPFSPP